MSATVQPRRPEWLKIRLRTDETFRRVRRMVHELDLNTVCVEARCPNIYECWNAGTATFMILGEVCTRRCGFCNVTSGLPRPGVDPSEPAHVAEAVERLGLGHAVITSVDRDDLDDGGAFHFNQVVRAAAERRDHDLRDMRVKSSLILGMGERDEEILEVMRELREVGVDVLTLGQYLQPTRGHLAVERYVTPEQFDELRRLGSSLGFAHVEAGPLVRSSYHAERHRPD